MVEVFANSEDPEQTPCSAASDLGLHCLPITLLRVSRLQWVNGNVEKSTNCIQPPLTVEFRYLPIYAKWTLLHLLFGPVHFQ